MSAVRAAAPASAPTTGDTALRVLLALSTAHLLNDAIQSVFPPLYPLLKAQFQLNFTQIGLITFAFQATASLLQPLVGWATDRRPRPYSLVAGVLATSAGIALMAQAPSFAFVLVAAALIGTGSAVFHPEASRLARLASGGRHGFAQSLFQVGGNLGSALGPLLAAFIVMPHGQRGVWWMLVAAALALAVLARVSEWYGRQLREAGERRPVARAVATPVDRRRVRRAMAVLVALLFSKFVYMTSLSSFYTFYQIERFGVSVHAAQLRLFVFVFAVAAGTMLGGPLGDRFGHKRVIWASILGPAPFALALPYAGPGITVALTVVIGVMLASTFSVIVVYAQEMLPGRVGFVAGLFFGLAFGIAGVASALLGALADATSLEFVYRCCSFLPLLGLVTGFLPDEREPDRRPA